MYNIDVYFFKSVQYRCILFSTIIDRTLRDVMNNDLLFGGKIVILGDDSRQLSLVLPRGIRSKLVNLSMKNNFCGIIFINLN